MSGTRYSSLPPRVKPMSRGSGLQRTGRLRPRSEKTQRIYVTRRQVVAQVLDANPWCQIRWDDPGCQRRSTEVHEPGMRSRGADICNPAECVAGCHYCHRMVHDHPAEATRRGWLIPSGKKRAA